MCIVQVLKTASTVQSDMQVQKTSSPFLIHSTPKCWTDTRVEASDVRILINIVRIIYVHQRHIQLIYPQGHLIEKKNQPKKEVWMKLGENKKK